MCSKRKLNQTGIGLFRPEKASIIVKFYEGNVAAARGLPSALAEPEIQAGPADGREPVGQPASP